MAALEINGHTYSELPIPDDYHQVYDKIVTRDGEQVHLRRYQPAKLKDEALQHERVVVLYRDDGYVMAYKALIHPSDGKMPNKKQTWEKAELVWKNVDPDGSYRDRLDRLSTSHQERTYINDAGETITVPITWAKYIDVTDEGNYCWVGLGANSEVLEFERDSYWDYAAGRESSEMWNYDEWILARRGDGPQLDAPLALA
ncbi:Hypothetical protein ADU72_0953 [Pediococcus damnosus]|uniref:Uncharacterized protein n=1 Tax=Pediococcus damnosus TaxID=51663 RepID=A0A0R2HDX7_9LACO|nr:hypothetical protein [Pediococcus damnosus]AMV60388.1 Hypothetical protein ADU69_0719 [Pediococcus damnosus]AMV63211.1 Hypothetical protein ADU70_1741 [Pediococcus damnosus]AMV64638.1 Hypothetical protein ADU71_0724 [Pediococcus damnosus]AMV66894.1 Hypothetical protein ADU72_0953 [Pediococcus damnosus]KJU74066.1 hypothetical protein AH70_08750 [Pediococcus damnosus LMG 28219]